MIHCDVRELANPVHCECISDGIETRTSPKLSPADRAAPNKLTLCCVTRQVSRLACHASESGSLPLRSALGLSEGSQSGFQSVQLRQFWQARHGDVLRKRSCLASRARGFDSLRLHHDSRRISTEVARSIRATRTLRPRCFGSMPECHSGWPGSTPGGRTLPLRTASALLKRIG